MRQKPFKKLQSVVRYKDSVKVMFAIRIYCL